MAVEHLLRRTALEHGAAQVIVVARRHGTICPKAGRIGCLERTLHRCVAPSFCESLVLLPASPGTLVLARQLTTWTSSSRGMRNTSTTPRPTSSSSCDGSSSTKHLAAGCRNAGRNRWSMTATPSLWAIFGSWPTTWRSFLRWQAHREDREGLQGVFMPREWFELGKPFSHSCIPVLRPGK